MLRPFPVALPSSMTLMASALVGLHTLKNSVVAASGGKSCMPVRHSMTPNGPRSSPGLKKVAIIVRGSMRSKLRTHSRLFLDFSAAIRFFFALNEVEESASLRAATNSPELAELATLEHSLDKPALALNGLTLIELSMKNSEASDSEMRGKRLKSLEPVNSSIAISSESSDFDLFGIGAGNWFGSGMDGGYSDRLMTSVS
mmetsp:Transcript_18744/g.41816  ORF Transcript_18744/g.41816 Transcript_18744/m.41816 type:complete len:200 (+) Transcript_18744:1437-2036(+)